MSGGDGGSFIRQVRLRDDKESCVLRFLTEYEDIYWERFHRVMENDQFKGMTVCVNSALQQACKHCEEGKRPSTLFMAWAYVYTQDYTSKPQRAFGEIEKVEVGRRTVYREQINEVRLLQASISHFDGIDLRYDRVSNITDRDYEWVRVGKTGTKRPSYSLEPIEGGKTQLSDVIVELRDALPDLEDVALGKVTSLGDDSESQQKSERPAVRTLSSDSSSVDEDEDPFDEI